MREILLDTCACIWSMEGSLPDSAWRELEQRVQRGEQIHISAVSAWEIAMLFARGRLVSPLRPQEYFRRLTASEEITVVPADPDYLIESTFLPGSPPADPWDRILVATAREAGLTLMTRDRALLRYAASGNLLALEC